jgi:hypothetical protein
MPDLLPENTTLARQLAEEAAHETHKDTGTISVTVGY